MSTTMEIDESERWMVAAGKIWLELTLGKVLALTDQPSITCPKCQRTSYNPNDIREGYCGNCNAWTTTTSRRAMPRIVCPDCGMSTWEDGFGCRLPGCENYAVIVGKAPLPEPVEEQGESEAAD